MSFVMLFHGCFLLYSNVMTYVETLFSVVGTPCNSFKKLIWNWASCVLMTIWGKDTMKGSRSYLIIFLWLKYKTNYQVMLFRFYTIFHNRHRNDDKLLPAVQIFGLANSDGLHLRLDLGSGFTLRKSPGLKFCNLYPFIAMSQTSGLVQVWLELDLSGMGICGLGPSLFANMFNLFV